jgi:polysaccharide biosynthesis protein PelD
MNFSYSRLLAPIGNPFTATVETLLLPAAMVVLGVWLSPLDPLFVRAQFPWTWIAPLVLALRYGPFPGLGGAVVLFLGWYGLEGLSLTTQALPKLYFLGGLIVVMLAGEFSSIWRARVRRAEATQDYLDQRLDNLTQHHYLLRLSHDRLEQELFSRPVSMRDALLGLREIAAKSSPSDRIPAADAFLKLASQFCQIERAMLVPVENDKPQAAPVYTLGAPFEPHLDDSLVVHAMSERMLSHVASVAIEERRDTRYLIVAPVADVTGKIHALLIVEALPFFALQEETLQMLNLMIGYYGDSLAAASLVAPIQAVWPMCPTAFALELQRLTHLRRNSSVPSALVALLFAPEKSSSDLPNRLLRQQRSLDVTWVLGSDPQRPRAVFAILPLARSAAVEGYLARIERWLASQHEKDWEGAGVRHRIWEIRDEGPLSLLERVLEECDVAAEARALRTAA